MGSFPGSPRTLRGAIVAVDPRSPLSRIVLFGYNPDEVSRSLKPRGAGAGQQVGPGDAHRIWGAPVETISMTVDVDATDQLEARRPRRGDLRDRPAAVRARDAALPEQLAGHREHRAAARRHDRDPAAGGTADGARLGSRPGRPGAHRRAWTITEQAFAPSLVPIRASVAISATVLTYDDLPVTDPGYALFLVHQVLKETLAVVGGVSGAISAVADLAGA